MPWLQNVALRDLVLHAKHAACVDARGDVYQWGQGLTEPGSPTGPILTLRGKARHKINSIGFNANLRSQNIKQLAISSNRLVALSNSGQVYILGTSQVQRVPSSSGGWGFWDSGDAGASVELTTEDKLPSGEK